MALKNNKKGYTKKEFLQLLGLGSAGLLFYQCYDSSKKQTKEVAVNQQSNKSIKKDSIPSQTPIKITNDDVVFLTRNDEKYNQLRIGFNKRFNQFPKIIALCKTSKGVQSAIQKANQENLKVAIKSGGHSFEAFSSNQDGMVINLSNMNNIEWIDNHQVKLQPACLLQEIYDDFLPKKRIIPAGSCGTVGIGGLTLGGGYGFFSRKYGLTCDNLLRVKMIDGQGNELDSYQDKDLLWACRGGGNGNFGVITEMYFKTHSAPSSFSSYRLKFRNLTEERFLTIANTWFTYSQNLAEEVFSAFVLNGKTLTILITNYQKHSSAFEQTFLELRSLADDYKPTYNQELSKALKRYYGQKGPIYFKNASAGLYKNITDIEGVLSSIFQKIITNKGLIYQINTLGGAINKTELNKESAYPHRTYNYLSELQAYWEEKSRESNLLSAFQEIQLLIQNNGITAQYRNYPDINFPNWQTAYYGSNYSKLQDLKLKYDPNNLFDFPQSVKAK